MDLIKGAVSCKAFVLSHSALFSSLSPKVRCLWVCPEVLQLCKPVVQIQAVQKEAKCWLIAWSQWLACQEQGGLGDFPILKRNTAIKASSLGKIWLTSPLQNILCMNPSWNGILPSISIDYSLLKSDGVTQTCSDIVCLPWQIRNHLGLGL